MLAGDPTLRINPSSPSPSARVPSSNVCHRCNGSKKEGFAPCDALDAPEFPLTPCPGGIRATVIFPSCWDGRNLDSPDHRAHMAYSNVGLASGARACPASHPVRVPQVMYEIMLDTREFNREEYFSDGTGTTEEGREKRQPFV
jgi:hypothetical protein